MKRIVLFLLTNLAVGLVLSITLSLLGFDRMLAGTGLNVPALVVFSIVMGFGGAIISLLLSKTMAKVFTGARGIDPPQSADEQWLGATVKHLPDKAGVGKPQGALYAGAPHAVPP